MQCGIHKNIIKISTRTNNNNKEKKSLQPVNQSGLKSFVCVEQDKDLNFFSASSLLSFCANITREHCVARRECGWKASNKM